MKIKRIEYENFRNFKDHGIIECAIDGKITIVYGKNGDGKTTLHQLFQWVFYGHVHFNKTTTDRLYNLQYESECSYGETFQVMGRIDFIHAGSQYSATRTITYRKDILDSSKIAEDFSIIKLTDDYDWKKIDNPNDLIELMLPSGLSDYFFFDGESMIADLRLKGKDSASKLKKALYSVFDLDIVQSAIDHIGRTDLKTTVLGKLFLSQGTISSDSEISSLKYEIETAQTKLEAISQQLDANNARIEFLKAQIQRISEQIGSTKSKSQYESERRLLKTQRDQFLRNATDMEARFGDEVMDMIPQLLISKAVEEAGEKINLKVSHSKLPAGISKKLIAYLLSEKTDTCVCGNPICDNERAHIRSYLDLLPPKSYANLYSEFIATARSWGREYEPGRLNICIQSVFDNNTQASGCDNQIQELDEAEKKSPDVEELIIARQKAEDEIGRLQKENETHGMNRDKYKFYLKKKMGEYEKLTQTTAAGKKVQEKIRIMEDVLQHFQEKKESTSIAYSKKLREYIQTLLDEMLTTKDRKVHVSQEFAVQVTDNYGDESKSEGQFAVSSFAYIGGILRLLQSEQALATKEYPLVLDGPFSKLDEDQRHNVVDVIPRFAPQVIIFSKDDLQEVIDPAMVGRIWTIKSNAAKNVAHVEEGFMW